jgi:AhpD family alkylhydroperoxidase
MPRFCNCGKNLQDKALRSRLNCKYQRAAQMMMNWSAYRRDLIKTIGQVAQVSPDVVKGYRAISDAGAKTAQLSPKTRELIALAVAVSLRCDGCIAVHTAAAQKHGATKEEIIEALGVAIGLNAGATLVYSARVMDAFQQHEADGVGGKLTHQTATQAG